MSFQYILYCKLQKNLTVKCINTACKREGPFRLTLCKCFAFALCSEVLWRAEVSLKSWKNSSNTTQAAETAGVKWLKSKTPCKSKSLLASNSFISCARQTSKHPPPLVKVHTCEALTTVVSESIKIQHVRIILSIILNMWMSDRDRLSQQS